MAATEGSDRPAGMAWVQRHACLVGFLIFSALSFAWFAKAWVDPFHRHVGLMGDPEAYFFAMAWPPFAVAHHLNPFYTTYLLAPKGANLMWTTPTGLGLLTWPLTKAAGVVFSYNLVATLSVGISAWTAQLALRRFVPGELGPFIGGLFYGFSPYMQAHSQGHVVLTIAILPPLLLLLVHEAVIRQRWWAGLTGLGLGVLLAFQVTVFTELIAGGAVAAGLLVALLAISYRAKIRERLRYFVAVMAAAGVSFLVLAGYPLRTMLFGARTLLHVHDHPHPTNVFVTDLLGFIVPSANEAFAPSVLKTISFHFTTVGAEIDGFIGLPLLIVIVVIVVRNWRSATVRIAAAMTAVMALLSMGPRLQIEGHSTIPLPWALFSRLPLMGNLLPVRLSVFTDLGIGLILAYGIAHRKRRVSLRRGLIRAIAASAIVVTVMPTLSWLSTLSTPVAVPAYFTSKEVKRIPDGSIALVAPGPTDPSDDQAEVWQIYSGFRFQLASGYAFVPLGKSGVSSGRLTDLLELAVWEIGLGELPPDLGNKKTLHQLRRDVRQHHISTIIIGPMQYQETMLNVFTYLMGRAPEHTGGVYVWYDVEQTLPAP